MQRDSHNSNTSDPDSMKPFFAAYERFERAITHTTPLGHAKSDKLGAFSFRNLEPGVRLLVIGISEEEDTATFYAVQEIETLHRGRNSIILDLDREEVCH